MQQSPAEHWSGDKSLTPNGYPKNGLRNGNFKQNRAFSPKFQRKLPKHELRAANPDFEGLGTFIGAEIHESEDINGETSTMVERKESVKFETETEPIPKLKHKKKAKRERNKGITNETFTQMREISEETINNNKFEVKRDTKSKVTVEYEDGDEPRVKKVKRKRNEGITNKTFTQELEMDNEIINNNTFEVKRDKKSKVTVEYEDSDEPQRKKAKRERNKGITNETFNQELETDNEIINNNAFEVKRDKNLKVTAEYEDGDEPQLTRKKSKRMLQFEKTKAVIKGVLHKQAVQKSIFKTVALESKAKKRKSDVIGFENDNFDEQIETGTVGVDNNLYEVKRVKKRKNELAIDNLNFNSNESAELNDYINGDYEVKRKKSKKCKKEVREVDNQQNNEQAPTSEVSNQNVSETIELNDYVNGNDEVVKRKKSKKQKNEAPEVCNQQNTEPAPPSEQRVKKSRKSVEKPESLPIINAEPIIEDDLMLNTTNTPLPPKPVSVKRRKSVRFNEITREKLIPSIGDQIQQNYDFDVQKYIVENRLKDELAANCAKLSNRIDCIEAEVENDLNEKKMAARVSMERKVRFGEPLQNGFSCLYYKYANLSRNMPSWMRALHPNNPKSAIKHLIRNDVVVGFRNANLYALCGYAVQKKTFQ